MAVTISLFFFFFVCLFVFLLSYAYVVVMSNQLLFFIRRDQLPLMVFTGDSTRAECVEWNIQLK